MDKDLAEVDDFGIQSNIAGSFNAVERDRSCARRGCEDSEVVRREMKVKD